jgi:hypothetical protein
MSTRTCACAGTAIAATSRVPSRSRFTVSPSFGYSVLRNFQVLREDVDDRRPGDPFGIECPIIAVGLDLPDRCRPSGHPTLTRAPRQNVTGAVDVANTVLTFRTFS